MIWFDIRELEAKIANNQLTDKDGYNYLLACFIVQLLNYIMPASEESGWIKFTAFVIQILLLLWGLKAAYNANKAHDGKDFIKRYIAISWVIGFRLLIILIGMAFAIGIIAAMILGLKESQPTTPLSVRSIVFLFSSSGFSATFYYLTIKSFRRLNTNEEEE